MLLSILKVGQYFELSNGVIYRVECNDWWENGRLRDFICVDAEGNKRHYAFLDSKTEINASIVEGFNNANACEKCGHVPKN